MQMIALLVCTVDQSSIHTSSTHFGVREEQMKEFEQKLRLAFFAVSCGIDQEALLGQLDQLS